MPSSKSTNNKDNEDDDEDEEDIDDGFNEEEIKAANALGQRSTPWFETNTLNSKGQVKDETQEDSSVAGDVWDQMSPAKDH